MPQHHYIVSKKFQGTGHVSNASADSVKHTSKMLALQKICPGN